MLPTIQHLPVQVSSRHDMLLHRTHKLLTVQGYVGVIDGDSGFGKSYCARKLCEMLLDNGAAENHIFTYAAQETDDGYALIEWLHNITAEDNAPKGWRAKGRAIMRRDSSLSILNVIKAGLKDLGAAFQVEQTAETFGDILGAKLTPPSFERAGSELLGKQISTVRTALERSSERYYVIVEGIEKIALPGLRVLQELVKAPPPALRLMLFTERTWKPAEQTTALKELYSILQQRHMSEIGVLSGLTVQEIQEWFKDVRNVVLSHQEAEAAYARSELGRPDILNSWIQSGSLDPNDVTMHGAAAWGQLGLKVDALTTLSVTTLEILASAYPMSLSIDQLQSLCSSSNETRSSNDILEAIKELAQCGSLIKQVHSKVSCANRNVCNFVKERAGEVATNYHNGLILSTTYGLSPAHSVLRENEMQLIPQNLQSADSNDPEAITALLGNIQSSLEHGSYRIAEKLLSSLESLPNNRIEHWQPKCQSLHAQLRADLAGQYGDFNEAIEWARKGLDVSSSPQETIKLETSIGDKCLQLGNYKDAYYHFKRARECALSVTDIENYVVAVIQSVKVLSDIGRYNSCLRILTGLVKSFSTHQISDRTTCLTYRWVARIYSLFDEYKLKAPDFADQALVLANKMGKERLIGNCQFVIGEVNRRLNNKARARTAYIKALDYAKISGNKDLEVYSRLGIILLSAQQKDAEVYSNLQAVRDVLKYHAPVEKLYVDVLETLFSLESNNSKDQSALDELIRNLETHKKYSLAKSLNDVKKLAVDGWAQSMAGYNWNDFVL